MRNVISGLVFVVAAPAVRYLSPLLTIDPIHALNADARAGLLVANIVLMNLWWWYIPMFVAYWIVYMLAGRRRRAPFASSSR
ncbi:hypothetical protein [Micropruina sp.]|uniref:hypothetical protein n=1 Tax=Micropruina sp. TaxID=2737536 RepID=UPI0039E52192